MTLQRRLEALELSAAEHGGYCQCPSDGDVRYILLWAGDEHPGACERCGRPRQEITLSWGEA